MGKYLYNLNKDVPDGRDYKFSTLIKKKVKLPLRVDLREGYSKVKDQGSLGACTAFSACSVMEYLLNKNIDLSELYFYYKEREADGNIEKDSGSTIRQSAKTARKAGTCEEKIYPYDISKFSEEPSPDAENDAANHRVKAYYRLNSLGEIMYTLGKLSRPVLIRADIYESFENTAQNGYINVPNMSKEQFLGYHAVNICGYFWTKNNENDKYNWLKRIVNMISGKKKHMEPYEGLYFIIRNSWGNEFADEGYMYAPAKFIEKFSGDWWYLEA